MAIARAAKKKPPKPRPAVTVSSAHDLRDAMIKLCRTLLVEFKKAAANAKTKCSETIETEPILANEHTNASEKKPLNRSSISQSNETAEYLAKISNEDEPKEKHPCSGEDGASLVGSENKQTKRGTENISTASLKPIKPKQRGGQRKQVAPPLPRVFSAKKAIPSSAPLLDAPVKEACVNKEQLPSNEPSHLSASSANTLEKDEPNIHNENKEFLINALETKRHDASHVKQKPEEAVKEPKKARLGAGLKLPPPPPFPGAPQPKGAHTGITQSERLRQAIAALSSSSSEHESSSSDNSNLDTAPKSLELPGGPEIISKETTNLEHKLESKDENIKQDLKSSFVCSPILGTGFQQAEDSTQILDSPSIHPKSTVVSPTGIPLWQRREIPQLPPRLSPAANKRLKSGLLPPSSAPITQIPTSASLQSFIPISTKTPPRVNSPSGKQPRADERKRILPSELFSATKAKLEQLASPLRKETTPRTASQTISKIKNKVAALLSTSTSLSKPTSQSSTLKPPGSGLRTPNISVQKASKTPIQKTPVSLKAINSSCVKPGGTSLRSPTLTPITRTRGTKMSDCRPVWTITPNLKKSLAAQSKVNPEKIFGAIQNISFEHMFPANLRRTYKPRGSSSVWEGTDALTEAEKQAYDAAMGYSPQ